MKRYIKTLFFLAVATLLYTSCSKGDLDGLGLSNHQKDLLAQKRSSLPSVIEILDLLNDPVDGFISITSYASYATQNIRGPEIQTAARFSNKNGVSKNFGALYLNSIPLPFNIESNGIAQYEGGFYLPGASSLYGDTISISLAGNNSENLPGLSTSFYSPPLIVLNSPAYQNDDTLTAADLVTIQWEADPSNQNGIAILLYYNASNPDNIDIVNSQSKLITVHTEDDGQYTFSSQEFSSFPDMGRVNFYIGRGNYIKAPMENPNYAVGIYNYSVITFDFTFDQ